MASFLGGLMAASVLLNVGILLLNLIGLYRVCQKMGGTGLEGPDSDLQYVRAV